MAVVFLVLNGVGLGHLTRATTLMRVLHDAGERPVVFSQGIFPLDDYGRFPGRKVPTLWKADEAERRRVASDIRSLALISEPAVLVEDTHPNPLRLPSEIRRVLVVRPTMFSYLSELNAQGGEVDATFLLCDAPESPTWPYTVAETQAILGWERWRVIGPVYRTADPPEVADLRTVYGVDDGTRICVFSMGGGGQQRPSDGDVERFVALANEVAEYIGTVDRRSRCIFVQGPYFPDGIRLSRRFEVIGQEPRMPALLALAHGAVIRAGFNTTWECIASGTPFLPFVGTTFAEPTAARRDGLLAQGLLTDGFAFWDDLRWREDFRARAERAVARWSGRPDASALKQWVVGDKRREPAPQRHFPSPRRTELARLRHRTPSFTARFRRSKRTPFVIRIDDVVSLDSTLQWLLRTLSSRRLRASLEVVPYLAQFSETDLLSLDPGSTWFEVSQHGYAHVPNAGPDGRRHEFAPDAVRASPRDIADIESGRSLLSSMFPSRFRSGFSPPFDALPAWLPVAWHEIGGTFISSVGGKRVEGSPLPVIQAGVDVWNWSSNRGRPTADVVRDMERQASAQGYTGIILHPRCLRSSYEKARLVRLLERWQDRGVGSVSLEALARNDAAALTKSSYSVGA